MRSTQGRLFAAVALVALAACSKGEQQQPEAAAAAPPAVSPITSSPPSATTTAMATNVDAPDNATMATAATSGPLTANTAQAGDPGDSSWVAQIDVDGDSTAAQATFVWDDEDKILYIAAEDDEVCAAGSTAVANTLSALYAAGNVAAQPVGSGWTATYLDATECGAAAPVLWGERFDSTGTVYAAGVATIDANGDLVIAVATDSTAAAPATN